MILRELTDGIKIKKIIGSENVEILGISHDSNRIRNDFLFAALRGEKSDGHTYIEQAVERGAKALLVEQLDDNLFKGVTAVQVEDTRSSIAEIAAKFYHQPTTELKLIGITGTNGKTTITYLLESILRAEGKNVGVIGTIEYRYSNKKISSNMTTPESLDLMELFRNMRTEGVDYAVMEVSSHALDKRRVHGCHFDAVVFTNLSQDHLDYHGTIENYFSAKRRLFTDVIGESKKSPTYSVINIDDSYGREIAKECSGRLISYSVYDRSAMVHGYDVNITNEGLRAYLKTPWGALNIDSKLLGNHNLSNIVAAAAAALALGISSESVEIGILNVTSVPGRLEAVENPFGINVVVDYAHTPDALRNVLTVVRNLTKGKLILVFGCGGDRDPLKRPIMGEIGRELSDTVIVTSDNPRTEQSEKIIDQIEEGVLKMNCANGEYFRIPDRRSAIGKAIEIAEEGDSVLIAGKGHENYQILGTKRIHFDDKEVAREKINEIIG